MRQWSVIALIAGCLLAAGCATKTDVVGLERRINSLDARTQALEKQLKNKMEHLNQLVEKRENQENRLRELFAGQDAEFYQLREDVRELSGRSEENEYEFKRELENLSMDLEANRKKLLSLSESVELNDTRISRLAEYLGIESEEKLDAVVKSGTDGNGAGKQQPSDLAEDKLYGFAKKSFDQKNYETARDAFEKFLETYPDSDKADNARFWIAEIYFNEEWYEKAILEYQKVIDDYPQGNKVAAAYLKQGMAFQELGEVGNARLLLKELIRKFPEANEAEIARKIEERIK